MIEPITVAIRTQQLIAQKNYLQGRLFQNQNATISLLRQPSAEGLYMDNLLALDNISIQTQLMAIDAELDSIENKDNKKLNIKG